MNDSKITLACGIAVNIALPEILQSCSRIDLEWESLRLPCHPDMSEEQWEFRPKKLRNIELPKERIAYYVTTVAEDRAQDSDIFIVESSVDFVQPGRVYYSPHERLSTPVNSQREAEEMVLDELRRLVRNDS